MLTDKNQFEPIMSGGRTAKKQVTFQVKTIQRSKGQSSVGSAAYRAGENLHDERIGRSFDYTRKDDILHSEIIAPDNSPEWVQDRQKLWNNVETKENRKDAQLARDITAALPRELSFDKNLELVRGFVQDNFVSKGMISDFNIHEAEASDGGKNPHVHIMLTMRNLTSEGFGEKNRDWNKKALLKEWRESWTQAINDALEDSGEPIRYDHRTLEEQGIDRKPTFHLGAAASAMKEKGIHTDKGQRLMVIEGVNKGMRIALRAQREEAKNPNLAYEKYMLWKEFSERERSSISPEMGEIQIDSVERLDGKELER